MLFSFSNCYRFFLSFFFFFWILITSHHLSCEIKWMHSNFEKLKKKFDELMCSAYSNWWEWLIRNKCRIYEAWSDEICLCARIDVTFFNFQIWNDRLEFKCHQVPNAQVPSWPNNIFLLDKLKRVNGKWREFYCISNI